MLMLRSLTSGDVGHNTGSILMDHDDGTVFAGEIHFHVVDLHNADLAAAQRFPRTVISCPCSLTIWISTVLGWTSVSAYLG